MTTPNLGTIENCDIREVWKDEARDFTPWLFNNYSELAKALGINLELHSTEHQVGRFSLDLIGWIPETKERVIIENQLEPSDHRHFGQLLTYAGGTEANYVVWIAREFKEEYLAAIQWLNNGTTEDINFFAVEVSAVRIGDSLPAPMFKVVAQPNGWQKEGRAAAAVALSGGRGQKQLEFWELMLESITEKHPDWTNSRKGRAQSWYTIPTGVGNIAYGCVLTGKEKRVEIVFWSEDRDTNASRFESLKSNKERIEQIFGNKLQWHFPEENKQAIVRFSTPANFDEQEKWPSYIDWFLEKLESLRTATHDDILTLR